MEKLIATDLQKFFGEREIFHDVTFSIDRGEKVGLVGANGSGKTTLFRCILGLEEFDAGSVKIDGRVGYVEQSANLSDRKLFDELKSKSVEDYQIRKVAYGLGFSAEDLERSANIFSGGQKTRILLAKSLLNEPDFLLLDEPTNHLDIERIAWLEKFLKQSNCGALIISHDRAFLDEVAAKIIFLNDRTTKIFNGNYSRFKELWAEQFQSQMAAYERQQEKIAETEEYIRRYRAGIKSKQARGRQSQLDRLERIEKPAEDPSLKKFEFIKPDECADRVVVAEDLSMQFDSKKLFSNLELLIRRGDRIALIGANGSGKTTLLKILLGEIQPSRGRFKIGSRVKIGYFSQHHEDLNDENSMLDEIVDNFGTTEEVARNYLGSFNFRGDEVFKKIGDLSGGEKARIALLKLFLTGANFLILDEPTNHLDIPAKEVIEEALKNFLGTILLVSHDRYFIRAVTDQIWRLESGAILRGGFELLEFVEKEIPNPKPRKEIQRRDKSPNKKSTITIQPEEIEAKIMMVEYELKAIEVEMNDPKLQSDPKSSMEIANRHAEKSAELESLYEIYGDI